MISSKVSTQKFSKAPQTSGLEVDKRRFDPAHMTAGDDEKSIGEKLNEIANPGGADPLKPKRRPSNELGKDDFLKLMLAQIKHQDPTNPLQSHEMAAHLAQFTSLEQLFNVNKNLESISKGQEPLQRYEVLNFLGRSIKADSKDIYWAQGDKIADLRFDLKGDATKIKVTIIDENGDEVRTIESGNLKKGLNKLVWNGMTEKDQEARPGKYSFRVEAENSAGRKVGVMTETVGTITGVNFTPEGPLLMVGDQKVRLQDVQKIEDEAKKEALKSETEAPQTPQNKKVDAEKQAMPVAKQESKTEVKVAGTKIPVDVVKGENGELKAGGAPFGRR